MKYIKIIILLFTLLIGFAITAFAQEKKKTLKQQQLENKMLQDREYLIAFLDTIWHKEQDPIRVRDTMIAKYGVESEQAQKHQQIYIQNHIINEKKIRNLLDTYGCQKKKSLEIMVIGL